MSVILFIIFGLKYVHNTSAYTEGIANSFLTRKLCIDTKCANKYDKAIQQLCPFNSLRPSDAYMRQ